MKIDSTIIILVAILLMGACSGHDDVLLYKPSGISVRIADSVMTHVRRGEISSQEEFNAARNKFARVLADSMCAEGLDKPEKFELAKILFWSGDRERAKTVFRELRDGGDELGQRATVELITMEIEDKDWGSAERLMKDYRVVYPPGPGDAVNLSLCVDDLAGRYNINDQPEDAIRVILDEIDHLTFDYPYPSFFLFEELIPLMIETDRLVELQELAGRCKENFVISLEKHLSTSEPDDSTAVEYSELTEAFRSQIKGLESIIVRLGLIGKKAPALNSLYSFNTDSAFTMKNYSGKVTVMDFWATWCVACVIGYQELNEIYMDYKESDFAILGITSLQGQYYNMDSGEQEGSKVTPLKKDREIELTAEYIEKNNMVWPCIISDRPVINPEYHISGLPTYVILDRDGIIRYMQMGVGKQPQIRRVLNGLLDKK